MMEQSAMETLLRSLNERSCFGEVDLVSVKENKESEIGPQFCSSIGAYDVTVRLTSGELETLALIVKLQVADDSDRLRKDTASLFLNEVTFYKDILPFLNRGESRPYSKLYYGWATGGQDYTKDVLVVEDLRRLGYRPSKEVLFLDYRHTAIAMVKIGELHGWSYTAKARNPESFYRMAKSLRKRKRQDDDNFYGRMVYQSMERGVMPFLENDGHRETLKRFLEIVKSVEKTLDFLREPEEPFGVILHGDYCKYNALYRYDSSDKPTDMAYFDFQTAIYGSPVVDLAFFLYMHTTNETRDTHWDEFLKIYWKSVRENVPVDTDLPSYQQFLEHFAQRAVYGYFHCSFYAPTLLDETRIPEPEFVRWKNEDRLKWFATSGGAIGLKTISDVVLHLIEKNYIQSFIEFYTRKCEN